MVSDSPLIARTLFLINWGSSDIKVDINRGFTGESAEQVEFANPKNKLGAEAPSLSTVLEVCLLTE